MSSNFSRQLNLSLAYLNKMQNNARNNIEAISMSRTVNTRVTRVHVFFHFPVA